MGRYNDDDIFEEYIETVIEMIDISTGYTVEAATSRYVDDLVESGEISTWQAEEIKENIIEAIENDSESTLSLIGMSEDDFM